MNFSSDHSFSGYFWILSLAIVLGLSPIQNIAASVSSCMDMEKTTHHQMNISSLNSHDSTLATNMAAAVEADIAHDCCTKNECATTHCAGVTTAAISSNFNLQFTYVVNDVFPKSNISLTPIYLASLYRPPKV